MRSVTAAALLLAGSTIAVSAAEACLSYTNRIGLTGRLIHRTYPGPPNYKSVARGDRPEKVLVLALAEPVCMAQDKADRDGMSPAIARITQVQLAATLRDLGGIKIGRTLRVTGEAFAAHTGHHHTPIVLDDVRVEPGP
ncbi:hypothetical protein ASG52_14240 [Methylobacterium sp. Leaf456]|uniref:DUF4431 domain-containing protein n=1 Tax=Methylobacterium sp. Leaf456 TaxID=1736382 RepID=UPI0006FAA6FA|nr:DUF4431 domain-containing protein [Methylobacterium sp. Leaf456]KQT45330.1 hypothetical protein ASG52_14240 [Methylobacterium sp. Leaf456]